MPPSLQDVLTRAFDRRDGSAAVLRISDGSILARYRPDWMKMAELPPGSAIKPFTLKAILRGGAGSMACQRRLRIAGRSLDCSHPAVSEPLDPAGALAFSCNCWFAAMAQKITPEVLWREFQAHGLRAGIARDRDGLVLEALGVDGIRCTPLDLARAYRRLALKRIQDAQAFAPVYQGLIESIQRGTSIAAGTAASAPVYGKTGTTSQSAWFAGFSSSIALAILLFQGTGGADAAPIAGEVLAAWQNGSR
jgi:cell division protein FtsI/penicillin-binding protein 2